MFTSFCCHNGLPVGQSRFAGVVRDKTVRLRPALSPLPLVLKHLSCTLYLSGPWSFGT